MSSVSGERLKIARNIKNYGLKELADVFHITLNALQKWQTRGISDRGIDVVAHHFHVQKWVFRDETLSEEQFVEIINNPDLMKKYRAIFTFRDEPRASGKKGFRSDSFSVSDKSILLRGKVWGAIGISSTIFAFVEKDKYTRDTGIRGSGGLLPSPQFIVHTDKDTVATDVVIEKHIINQVGKGEYYISAHISAYSDHHFELSIFHS